MSDPDTPGPSGEAGLIHFPTLTARRKRPEDSPGGCREMAAADLRRADALVGDHVRWRYLHSAEAWTARAELLDRLEAKFQARVRGAAPANDVLPKTPEWE